MILFFILTYLVLHIPAFILLIIGLFKLKAKPESAKKFLILSGIYFLIGGGICGSLLTV